MKCNVATGMKLEQFKDIKVGPYQSEVVYGSPSYEPYPDLSKAAQHQGPVVLSVNTVARASWLV